MTTVVYGFASPSPQFSSATCRILRSERTCATTKHFVSLARFWLEDRGYHQMITGFLCDDMAFNMAGQRSTRPHFLSTRIRQQIEVTGLARRKGLYPPLVPRTSLFHQRLTHQETQISSMSA